MTTQLIAPTAPAAKPSRPVRHRHIRTAAAIAGVSALVATGGYVATTIIGSDGATTAVTGAEVNPSAQALGDLRDSVAGQYGSRTTSGATVDPSTQAEPELRDSVAGQYGSRTTSGATVDPSTQAESELRDSVAGQYGH